MGVMRFIAYPSELLADWPEVHRAYLSGVDQSAWAVHLPSTTHAFTSPKPNPALMMVFIPGIAKRWR